MTVILFSKIRRMYFRDKLSINEIARRTSLSRNTVKRWLRMPGETDPKYKRRPQATKLTPFEDQLKRALIADSYRPKRERRMGLKLLEELQKAGYTHRAQVRAAIRNSPITSVLGAKTLVAMPANTPLCH